MNLRQLPLDAVYNRRCPIRADTEERAFCPIRQRFEANERCPAGLDRLRQNLFVVLDVVRLNIAA